MKTVILAGGLGTRLSEETTIKPKPMVEIGNLPILWHIMKIYSHYGFNDFIICLGYKGYFIKEWFSHYYLHRSDITFNFQNNTIEYHKNSVDPWKVTLVDTGEETLTGGRIRRIKDYVGSETFMMTYGDGVSDIDIHQLVKFHREHKSIATMSAVTPGGRFGTFTLEGNRVVEFFEKEDVSDKINGGFFVLEPEVFDYIEGDMVYFEQSPLKNLAKDGKLKAYIHDGFWKCMDSLKDKKDLEELWAKGAPWKLWASDNCEDKAMVKIKEESLRW